MSSVAEESDPEFISVGPVFALIFGN